MISLEYENPPFTTSLHQKAFPRFFFPSLSQSSTVIPDLNFQRFYIFAIVVGRQFLPFCFLFSFDFPFFQKKNLHFTKLLHCPFFFHLCSLFRFQPPTRTFPLSHRFRVLPFPDSHMFIFYELVFFLWIPFPFSFAYKFARGLLFLRRKFERYCIMNYAV